MYVYIYTVHGYVQKASIEIYLSTFRSGKYVHITLILLNVYVHLSIHPIYV